MTDCIKSESYIYANLCHNVSCALYDAMMQKQWTNQTAVRKAHGGNMSLSDIASTLAELGAHMEVTIKFIDAPATMEGKKA
jgi:MFS-type transporter involved in bile tolerance (Atg22 family)